MPANKPPEAMTDEELCREVAEWRGLPWRKPTHGECCTCQKCGHDHDNCQCYYIDCIENAWALVEEMRKAWWGVCIIDAEDDGGWLCEVRSDVILIASRADTAARAICKTYVQWKREEAGK